MQQKVVDNNSLIIGEYNIAMTEDEARVHLLFLGYSLEEVKYHLVKIRKMNNIKAQQYIEGLKEASG